MSSARRFPGVRSAPPEGAPWMPSESGPKLLAGQHAFCHGSAVPPGWPMLAAAAAGFAGLGSETLFFKLLDDTVGSSPLVAFAVVATFILGMGTGSLLSPKVRRPWAVEAMLSVYS